MNCYVVTCRDHPFSSPWKTRSTNHVCARRDRNLERDEEWEAETKRRKSEWGRKVGRGRRQREKIMWLMWRSPLFTKEKTSPTLLLSCFQIFSFSVSCFPNSLLTSSPLICPLLLYISLHLLSSQAQFYHCALLSRLAWLWACWIYSPVSACLSVPSLSISVKNGGGGTSLAW